MARKKKRNTRFRKQPLTADCQNWNQVDWRALGYPSFNAFYADIQRRRLNRKANFTAFWYSGKPQHHKGEHS